MLDIKKINLITAKKVSLFLLLVSSLLSSSLVYAQCKPESGGDEQVVVLYGDSITAGISNSFRDGSGDGKTPCEHFGRPSLETNAILNEHNRPAYIINWGVGGSSSEYGKGHINQRLSQTKGAYPQASKYRVLILYGTNDWGYGLSPSDTGGFIRKMIDHARDQGYIPAVATVTPRSDRDASFINSLNSAIRQAAQGRSASMVDLYQHFINYGPWGNLLEHETSYNTGQPIQLHPNNLGYRFIAEKWYYDYLQTRIPETVITPEAVITPVLQLLLLDDEN